MNKTNTVIKEYDELFAANSNGPQPMDDDYTPYNVPAFDWNRAVEVKDHRGRALFWSLTIPALILFWCGLGYVCYLWATHTG